MRDGEGHKRVQAIFLLHTARGHVGYVEEGIGARPASDLVGLSAESRFGLDHET